MEELADVDTISPPKIVLYSCYYGAPEPLNHDVFGTARGKYPCFVFTDDPTLALGEGVTRVHDPLNGLDPNRASRRAKLMPDRYLPSCDWSIYLDNNMRLNVCPSDIVAFLGQFEPTAVYVTRHPERDCTFEEAKVCSRLRLDDRALIRRQMNGYAALGLAAHAGLPHGGFLVRRHADPRLSSFSFHWYEHVLAYARRDQLSFSFVAYQSGMSPCYIENMLDGQKIFEWPAFERTQRRDWKMRKPRKKSFCSRVIKPMLRQKYPKIDTTDIASANTTASGIYRDRLGNIKVEPKGLGAVLIKYETREGFDYAAYKDIQNAGNILKLGHQWVGRDHIELISGLVKKYVPGPLCFGICHGTRRGNEQLWFKEFLGDEVKVIGTEIADTATQFPNTVQWDFHLRNEDWVGRADFVYSNSWDHSYDPEVAFAVWIESLVPGGVMLLDWSEGHDVTGVTEMDPFGASLEHLVELLESRFSGLGSVLLAQPGKKHMSQQITTVVFQRSK